MNLRILKTISLFPLLFACAEATAQQPAADPTVVKIEAIRAANLVGAKAGSAQWGPVLVNNVNGGNTDGPNRAEYLVNIPRDGRYAVRIRYAAADPRPIKVIVDKRIVNGEALTERTGCWEFSCQKWASVGQIDLTEGLTTLVLDRAAMFPHISAIELALTPSSNSGGTASAPVNPPPQSSAGTSPAPQRAESSTPPSPGASANTATALPEPPSISDPLDKLAYEAFCQNNEQQIASVSVTVPSTRALDLSYRALIDCPERNTGPFFAAGSFWNKSTPTTTVGFFFKTVGPNFQSTPLVWQTIPVYVSGEPTKLFGRDYRPLRRAGARTVLLPYSPVTHALNAFSWRTADSTSIGGVFGAEPEKEMAFSDANLRSIVAMLPDKFPPTNPLSAKYSNRFDAPNCIGLPSLASSVLAQRYAAVNGLLDRNADVNVEVAALTEAQGVPLEFLEPAKFNERQNSPLMVLKKGIGCFELRSNGTTASATYDIIQAYRNISASIPFFDYFLLLYQDRPGAKEAFQKIIDRVAKVSPGVLPFMISSPKFGINLRQQEGQEIVKRLIAKGADINARDSNGNTSLKILMNNAIAPDVYQFMVSQGAQL